MDLSFNPFFVLYMLVGAFTANMYICWIKHEIIQKKNARDFAFYTMLFFFLFFWPIFWIILFKEKVFK